MCTMQASCQPFDCAMFPAPRQRTSKQHVFNSELRCAANPAWFTSQPPFPHRRRSRNTGANSCVISWAFTHRYLEAVWRRRNGVPSLSSGGQKPDNKVLAGQWPLRGFWGKIFLSLPSLNAPGTGLCSWIAPVSIVFRVSLCLAHVRSRVRPATVLAPPNDVCSHFASRYGHVQRFRTRTSREL